jgi:hypothetical protein
LTTGSDPFRTGDPYAANGYKPALLVCTSLVTGSAFDIHESKSQTGDVGGLFGALTGGSAGGEARRAGLEPAIPGLEDDPRRWRQAADPRKMGPAVMSRGLELPANGACFGTAQGATLAEARANLEEAVRLVLEANRVSSVDPVRADASDDSGGCSEP